MGRLLSIAGQCLVCRACAGWAGVLEHVVPKIAVHADQGLASRASEGGMAGPRSVRMKRSTWRPRWLRDDGRGMAAEHVWGLTWPNPRQSTDSLSQGLSASPSASRCTVNVGEFGWARGWAGGLAQTRH